MKLSFAATSLALAALTYRGESFIPSPPTFSPRVVVATASSSYLSMSETVEAAAAEGSKTAVAKSNANSKKNKRLDMFRNPQFFRRGFKEERVGVEETMGLEYQSTLVDEMKASENVLRRDGVTAHLAKDFGFCWGVERSIALAYEAVRHFPDKKVHITNELIHNPEVNDKLADMGVQFIEKKADEGGVGEIKDFTTIEEGDVVILPAFGASFEEMDFFDKKNVDVVDTTCPWVSKVWNTVDAHQKKGLTSIIHGKYEHEETIATVSFCEEYICVKNMKEAEMVSDYMLGKESALDREAFMEHFKNGMSDGFDPDTMLTKVGLANQTTMYKKETRAIGQLLQRTMMEKFGPVEAKDHYHEFDTICDATQERQDAVHDLVVNSESLGLDFILVVGGWDSSNTAHLLEIPIKAGVRSFHINRADCIGADNTITHRTVEGEILTETFVTDLSKEINMGVTSGASTPDNTVQDSLSTIFLLKKMHEGGGEE